MRDHHQSRGEGDPAETQGSVEGAPIDAAALASARISKQSQHSELVDCFCLRVACNCSSLSPPPSPPRRRRRRRRRHPLPAPASSPPPPATAFSPLRPPVTLSSMWPRAEHLFADLFGAEQI